MPNKQKVTFNFLKTDGVSDTPFIIVTDGSSAFEIWAAAQPEGTPVTEADYLAYMKGEPGKDAVPVSYELVQESLVSEDGTEFTVTGWPNIVEATVTSHIADGKLDTNYSAELYSKDAGANFQFNIIIIKSGDGYLVNVTGLVETDYSTSQVSLGQALDVYSYETADYGNGTLLSISNRVLFLPLSMESFTGRGTQQDEINVRVSEAEGNTIELTSEGLFVAGGSGAGGVGIESITITTEPVVG